MALTPFRWISLAAIGCMLAVVGLASLADRPQRFRTPGRYNPGDSTAARLREGSFRLTQEAMALATRYRALVLMDSVKRVASRLPDTGAYRVFISDTYDADLRSVIGKAVREALNGHAGNAGKVDLFVINDTSQSVRGVSRYNANAEVRYEMPAVAGDRCRVYVRTGPFRAYVRRNLMYENTAQQLLGPCAYYAAFGDPGPRIKEWISSVGWQYTLEGSWTVAPVKLTFREDEGIFKGPSPAIDALNLQGGGPACIKGDLAACERAMGLATPTISRSRMRIAGATYSQGLGYRRYSGSAMGQLGGEFLADATRELGRERFKAFWTSSDSVNVAFEKAAGQRWGAFVRQWMISRYGDIEAGPRASGFAIALSAALVLVALGLTMRRSVTREYV